MTPLRRILAGCVLAAACSVPPVRAGEAPAIATRIDELLSRSFPAEAPGAAVLVVSRGEVLLRKGYGAANLELGVPVQPEHVFRIGSITKQFTAVAILQLVAAGKVRLEDEIRTYVPGVETHGEKITLEHLLTHTSGLPSFTDEPAWRAAAREDMTLARELEFIRGRPAKFQPGTGWQYCNTGYRLLGEVIEKVTGRTYAAYLEEHVFQPAGLAHSSYDDPRRLIPGRIPGYSPGAEGRTLNAEFVSMTQPHAAGALLSNVDDLWKWEQALAAGRLVPPELLARAYTEARLADGRGAGYGFGWSIGTISGHPAVAHGGGIQGFSTYVLRVADAGLFIAVLCNSNHPKLAPGAAATRIAGLILGPRPGPSVVLPEAVLHAVAGVYRIPPADKFELAVEGGRLVAKRARGTGSPLDAVSADEFVAAAGDFRYRIVARDPAGRSTRVAFQRPFAQEFHAERVDEPLLDPEKAAVVVAPELLQKYPGDYELAPNFILTVRRDGDSLTAQATGQGMLNLVAESATRFRVKQVAAVIEFKPDASGLVLFQNGREMPAKRRE